MSLTTRRWAALQHLLCCQQAALPLERHQYERLSAAAECDAQMSDAVTNDCSTPEQRLLLVPQAKRSNWLLLTATREELQAAAKMSTKDRQSPCRLPLSERSGCSSVWFRSLAPRVTLETAQNSSVCLTLHTLSTTPDKQWSKESEMLSQTSYTCNPWRTPPARQSDLLLCTFPAALSHLQMPPALGTYTHIKYTSISTSS